MLSVVNVSSTLEPIAGSRPNLCIAHRNEYSDQCADQKVQEHRVHHHHSQGNTVVEPPRKQSRHASPDQAVQQADRQFLEDHPRAFSGVTWPKASARMMSVVV